MKILSPPHISSDGRRSATRPVALLTGLLAGLVLAAPAAARAQVSARLQNLAVFGSVNNNGGDPSGPLVQGSDGFFYGTTAYGGANGRGTVFKASAAGAITTLYSFGGSDDGGVPTDGVIIGNDGNLYGTTSGSSGLPVPPFYYGTIFRLTPAGVLTTLHQFDGTAAFGLVQGRDGNFYGVAPAVETPGPGPVYPGAVQPGAEPDAGGDGIFFRITPTGDFTVLYDFTSSGDQNPTGKLSLGTDGNFYGVSLGSSSDDVYRITPDGTLTTIFPFSAIYGVGTPNDGLVQTADGSLYGTTFNESTVGGDTVFRIDRGGGLATLHTFNGNDGKSVRTGLTLGSDGFFYGTTASGGVNSSTNTTTNTGYGTIFQITPAGVLTTLYNFAGDDGTSPNELLQASDGLFYGTTADTVANGASGNFFALSVSNQPAFFTGEVALTKGVYYLQFPNTDFFGYYTFLSDPHYLYHYDLGYEYVFDADDGEGGVYLYDFASGGFFYTSPTFPFPYLYDFALGSVLYYYPINFAGRYSSNPRYFYDFSAGQIITK